MDLLTCRTVLVYGGSFDPPHHAHVALPLLAMEKINADAVAYIPAGQAPHKAVGAQTPAVHRLAMLRLALENCPHAFVMTDELERAVKHPSKPTYTVETLELLREKLGASIEMRLLIGSDMISIFDSWKSPELAPPVGLVRPPQTRESLLATIKDEQRRAWWATRLIEANGLEMSSTLIRERASRGASLAGLVEPSVENYIRRHELYRVR